MRRKLSLFLASLLFASQAIAEPLQLYEYDKLTGGLNDSFDEVTIDSSEASDLLNIFFPEDTGL